MPTLLLYDLQSPINIGICLRVAEGFGVPVQIWDPRDIFSDADAVRWISDFSCGAYARKAFNLCEQPDPALRSPQRSVATCKADGAQMLPDFAFRPDDVVAIGNEYDGLPAAYIAGATARLTIPMPDFKVRKLEAQVPIDDKRLGFSGNEDENVLSSSMSAGIICYQIFATSLR